MSTLPVGRFLATLIRRQEIAQEQGGGIEYTFRVAVGDYQGERISMRLWARGRIARADLLSSTDSVELVVGHRQGGRGARFARVHDFRKASALTAADAVRGKDDSTDRVVEDGGVVEAGTFRPYPLLTELEKESAISQPDEGECDSSPQVPSFPVFDDRTVAIVTNAATAPVARVLACLDDAPDFSEFDDDEREHRWIVTRSGGAKPVAVNLGTDTEPGFLPSVADGAEPRMAVSLFRYRPDLDSYMGAHHHSVRGYGGIAWAPFLPVRLLSDHGLAEILEPVRLIAQTCVKLGVPREQVLVVNDCNVGLTMLIPSCAAMAVAQVGFERAAGHFAQALADLACGHMLGGEMEDHFGYELPKDRTRHLRIDRQIYGPVAVHPVINSTDESGRLFAVAMSYAELVRLPVTEIEKLAAAPRPVPRVTWRAKENDQLVELWGYAVEAERLRARRYAALAADTPFVFPDTFDWMLHGSGGDSAPKRLYRAAENLLRLGCGRGAVVALLGPAASISGLGVADVEWSVECAAKALVAEGYYWTDEWGHVSNAGMGGTG